MKKVTKGIRAYKTYVTIGETKYEGVPLIPRKYLNKYHIPINRFKCTKEDADRFNQVFQWMKSIYKDEPWTEIQLTKSGAICKRKGILRFPAFYIGDGGSTHTIELIVLIGEGQFRFVFGKDREHGIDGRTAFNMFQNACDKLKVDLRQFAVSNGKWYKDKMKEPSTGLTLYRCRTQECMDEHLYGKGVNIPHCHHLDLNTSFMSGIYRKHEELRPVIQDLYDKRAKDPVYKEVLTKSYGFMQSQYCREDGHGYAYANLSLEAVQYNNAYIRMLLKRLRNSGRKPLLINTDGIWYQGEIYHDDLEGTQLLQWKTDYINCTINIKSDASYQFKGTDCKTGKEIFKPVYSGVLAYEQTKPREEFEWDDIYKSGVINFNFDRERGITYETNDN